MFEENAEIETGVNEGAESFEQEQSLDYERDKAILEDLDLDPSKYGIDLNEEEFGDDEESSDEESGETAQENSIIEAINQLGLVHNDNPLTVENEEQLKSLIQQGFDYTKKTQSLADERKSFEVEKTQAETDLHAAINEFNQMNESFSKQLEELQSWQYTLQNLQSEAPDVYEEIQSAYNRTLTQFKNPIIEQQMAALQKQFQEAQSGLKERENRAILDEFEREKASLGAVEQSINELGLKIDWDKVKGEWKDTGLPVKKVVGSLYFEEIAKAQASKAKVAATQAKVNKKPTGAATSSRPAKVTKDVKNNGDYLSMAMEMYKNLK